MEASRAMATLTTIFTRDFLVISSSPRNNPMARDEMFLIFCGYDPHTERELHGQFYNGFDRLQRPGNDDMFDIYQQILCIS
jgi:hypothetical protein